MKKDHSIFDNPSEKKYFTKLFFKIFFFLETALLLLALVGLYKFSSEYYQNHYKQVKNEVRRLSFLSYELISLEGAFYGKNKKKNKAKVFTGFFF